MAMSSKWVEFRKPIWSSERDLACVIKTDTAVSGRLYEKLNAFVRDEVEGLVYIGSSCQFRTQRKYAAWLVERLHVDGDAIVIRGDEE